MNKGAWIAIIAIAVILIGGIILFNSGSNKETTTGTSGTSTESPINEYYYIENSVDDFYLIDDAISFIE